MTKSFKVTKFEGIDRFSRIPSYRGIRVKALVNNDTTPTWWGSVRRSNLTLFQISEGGIDRYWNSGRQVQVDINHLIFIGDESELI